MARLHFHTIRYSLPSPLQLPVLAYCSNTGPPSEDAQPPRLRLQRIRYF